MAENKKVYVVGHKNPDTDSICTAIAYANLKTSEEVEKIRIFMQFGNICYGIWFA